VRNARCFALGNPRFPCLNNFQAFLLTGLSFGIVWARGGTKFFEQRRFDLYRRNRPILLMIAQPLSTI
jgi:hypothetical protein